MRVAEAVAEFYCSLVKGNVLMCLGSQKKIVKVLVFQQLRDCLHAQAEIAGLG